jgi:O-antigen ligase
MYYSDEKPKNDDYKPKHDDYGYVPRERGGCLTVFLVVLTIGMPLALLFYCSQFGQLGELSQRYGATLRNEIVSAQLMLSLICINQIGAFVCVTGLWDWKKWGYSGLLVAYGISVILNLMGGNVGGIVGALLGAGVLYYLVNERIEMFE